MQVRKRNGSFEPVNLEKIVNSIRRVCEDLGSDVDVYKVATKTVGGLVDGVSTREIDLLSIRNAVGLISEDPSYSKIAGRILANVIQKEVGNQQDIQSFSQSIETGHRVGLISEQTYNLVMANKRKLNDRIRHERDWLFEFHGIQTLYDRYLLKHPTATVDGSKQRVVIETPQYFLMRVACGLADDAAEAVELYDLLSSLEYMCSTPTLFNAGTRHSQMSSCYLLDSPLDSLDDIYKRYGDIAMLSKFAGGIGVSASRIRGKGALIKGTNGKSNGIVPWLHTLSGSVAAVNQGGKRKGAAAVYLEPHHPDIMDFLELRDNTGEKERRAYNLNLANWVSDLFMRRVKDDAMWSLIDPTVAPELTDLYGDEYDARYEELEATGKVMEQIPARKVYARMMRTLAETGNGWMCFKDTSNKRGNQVGESRIIHLSNLCTEILEVTSAGKKASIGRNHMQALTADEMVKESIRITGFNTATDTFDALTGAEVAVCNLGSINIGRGYVKNGKLDKAKLRRNVAIAVKYLDRVIDRNYYPVPEAHASNMRWRPVGLGLMGLADFFMQMRLPYESEDAIRLSGEIQEEIYYQALRTSCDLAKQHGMHRDFDKTRAAQGLLQFDLAGVTPKDTARWETLRADIVTNGLRNSLLIAIAPTATISHICGVEECIEAVKSNLLKRETLSGEFIGVNRYLVDDLKAAGMWNDETRRILVRDEGSVANIPNLPPEMKAIYKTVWEMSMKPMITHAATRGAFIDQSQSLNFFIDLNKYPEERRIGVLSSLYMSAWESGLKTTYYFRSRAASRIEKTTIAPMGAAPSVTTTLPVAAAMAPEENEVCESCT
jgi:ribonucleoside-diphosphate reductase alpha chain